MPDDATPSPVLLDRDGAVAVLTLNRPQRYNALTVALKEALLAALTGLAADEQVRAVVLTGAGPAFCAGQDLAEHAALLRDDPVGTLNTVAQHYNPLVRTLTTMPKPVVAAVNGTCVGAGLGLALAADLRVAAEGARFATAFTGVGLGADSGVSATLAQAVGAARARELLLLGEPFDAAQAHAWGLLRAVVPAEQVLDTARALAERLAAGPTLAYAAVKQTVAIGVAGTLDDALDAEAAAQTRLATTRDHRAAVEAFVAKQRPTFEGR